MVYIKVEARDFYLPVEGPISIFPGRIGLWRRRSDRGEMPPKEAEGPGKFPTSGE